MAGGRLISHGINAEEWKKCVPIMPYGLIDEYFAADYASSMPKSLRRAELELSSWTCLARRGGRRPSFAP